MPEEGIMIPDSPIALQEVLARLRTGKSGSIVIHIGIVRPVSDGREVGSIEYKVAEEEATQELTAIASEVKGKWKIEDLALARRAGQLENGETILVAAVSAPHRKEAFEACDFAVERMRKMASIQKKELFK